MAHSITDVENYLVIPNEIKIVVSPEVQNIWKESDAAWHLFLNERMRPQMWAKSSVVLAVNMCWEMLIPKMNPGATCITAQYRSESSPRVDQAVINLLMWIGRDGSGDTDTAAATVPMSVRIPVPKDNEDLIITVEATTIRPAGASSYAQKVGMIRNAADILINQEKFQSQDDRNKVIGDSLRERYQNTEALDPNEIVVNDPGPPKDLRGKRSAYSYGEWMDDLIPYRGSSYVSTAFSFQFTEATLWGLRLPPFFIITKTVHYPRAPGEAAAAA